MSFYDDPDQRWGNPQWAPQPPAGEPSRLGGLRTALTVLLTIIAVVSALSAAAYAVRVGYVNDVIESGSIDRAAAEDADALVATTVILWFLLLLAIAPVLIVWQFRHAKNTRALGHEYVGVSRPGWAIGGWFIPLGNLFIPAINLYRNGQVADPDGGDRPPYERRGPGVVVAWAICWGLAAALDRGAQNSIPEERSSNYLEGLRTADQLSLAANVGYIAAAVLAILMVRTLTARQEAAFAARPASIGQQPYAAWPAAPPGYGQPPYGQQPYGQPQPGQNPPPSPFAPVDQPPKPDGPAAPPAPPPPVPPPAP